MKFVYGVEVCRRGRPGIVASYEVVALGAHAAILRAFAQTRLDYSWGPLDVHQLTNRGRAVGVRG